jgi:hypothetical protein
LPPQKIDAEKSLDVDANAILTFLTARQHLRPHAPIHEVLEQSTQIFGCCPNAISRGIQWLGVDPQRPIGRFRRSEILQLANAIHRFWMQNLATAQQQ